MLSYTPFAPLGAPPQSFESDMPWRPLSRIAFAVAIYPFQPSSPADLPLELGDELYIIEQGGTDGSWYRGYLVAPPSLLAGLTSVKGQTLEARVFSGIFPRSCVEVREVLGDTRVTGEEEGVEQDDIVPNHIQTNGGINAHLGVDRNSDGPSRTGSRNGSTKARGSLTNGRKKWTSGAEGSRSRPLSRRKSENASFLDSKAASQSISDPSVKSRESQRSVVPIAVTPGPREPGAPRTPAPVPMLKIGDETPTSTSEPLVDEIASCLREWHSTNLHELLLSRRYSVLERLSALVHQLDVSRRQLLHGVLTAQELRMLREKTIWSLVGGNKMLSSEVIVRDPKQRGRLLTSDDSVVEMTKLQSTMSLLEKPLDTHIDLVNLHHLLVDVKAVASKGLESPTLVLYLCSKSPVEPPHPLTDCFVLNVPPEDQFSQSVSSEKLKTLFTDLTSFDIGESSGANSQLYLVVKVQASQQPKVAFITPVRAETPGYDSQPTTPLSSNSIRSSTAKGGRQSLMWAQKQLGSSYRNRGRHGSKSTHPPATADSSASATPSSRPSTPMIQRPATQQGSQSFKRSVGVGVLNITQLMGQTKDVERTVQIWSPAEIGTGGQESDSQCDDLIRDLLTSHSGKYAKSQVIDHARVHIHSFLDPDPNALISKTPTLLQNVIQTPKIGFSGAPTKARSDIYLTIREPFLPRQALLSHPERGTVPLSSSLDLRNLQLTIEVRKASGERIEHCIFPSSNSGGQTAWRTIVVERGEAWNQTIRLAIASEDVPGAHLIMSVADAPGFPFALCWMPLWDQQAFMKDGTHSPLLYLYDKMTSSTDSGRGAYLDFPWSSRGKDDTSKDETLTGPVATLRLVTYLCSTKFSQDKVLLGILKWREQSRGQLQELLQQLVFVPEIEVMKVLSDVLDALFGILVDHAGQDEFGDSVLKALVTVLGTVHDRRFNLVPLVDQYAENEFDYPFATPCLIRSYLRLLSNPTDPQSSRDLRATFKVGRHILKFIMSAREKQKIKEAGIGTSTQATFNRDVNRIFRALEALMKDPSPTLIGSKTLVVQHMHTWLPELAKSFTDEEILQMAFSFVDSCDQARGRLILYKLVLILNISELEIFKRKSTRQLLASNTTEWLASYWGSTDQVTDQWREQVRLCCSIVSTQVSGLGSETAKHFVKAVQSYRTIQRVGSAPKQTLSMLFPATYPFSTKAIAGGPIFDEALIELAALLSQLSKQSFHKYLAADEPGTVDVLIAALEVNASILGGEAFPSSWLSLHVYHHKSILQMLEQLFEIISNSFLPSPDDADQFNTDIWKAFLVTLLKLVRSDALALETFPEQKRRAVWKIAGDVREQGADLLRRSWAAIGWETNQEDQRRYGLDRMGGFQVQYVPGLVAPIVELCLSVHEGLRGVAVKIMQAMIVSEWTLSDDLSIIEAEVIDALDHMFKSKTVGESLQQRLFVNELMDLFEPLARVHGDGLWQALKALVATVDELLDLLMAVHSTDNTEAFRIMHTLRLMDFLRDMQKENIFVRYVHQLAQVQAKSGNTTAAGLALRLHADLYTWDSTWRVKAIANPKFPDQSSFERREQLFFEMIGFFEEGQAWNSALACYQELAVQYESYLFDFAKLARTQHAMAKIHETISKGEIQTPRYFRVVYRGLGFPVGLRDKQFIFEGAPAERVSAFTDRMQQQHPSAQVVPSGDIEDVEGQFLQISAVSPHRDLEHPLYQRWKIPQSTRDYVLYSQASQFTVTSRRHSPSSDVKTQWIEKTVYTTAESFPTILRRSEIVNVDTVLLSPLQTAIERTLRKTSELAALQQRMTNGEEAAFTNLTEAISNSVDPSSVSSVAQYRQLLPFNEPTDADDEAATQEVELQPLENALKMALYDHALRIKQCLNLYSRPAYQATQADLSRTFHSTFAPELTVLAPSQQYYYVSPPSTASPPNSVLPPAANTSSRHSWISPGQLMPPLTSDIPSSPTSKSPSQLNGDHTRADSVSSQSPPRPDISQSRFEKAETSRNRLSLSFLRRGSTDNTATSAPKTNGANHIGDEHSSSRARSRSRETRNHETRPPLVSHESSGRSAPPTSPVERRDRDQKLSSMGRSDGGDLSPRPTTSETTTASWNPSEAETGMRKRLSLLGIGRKGNKASVNVASVVEQ